MFGKEAHYATSCQSQSKTIASCRHFYFFLSHAGKKTLCSSHQAAMCKVLFCFSMSSNLVSHPHLKTELGVSQCQLLVASVSLHWSVIGNICFVPLQTIQILTGLSFWESLEALPTAVLNVSLRGCRCEPCPSSSLT